MGLRFRKSISILPGVKLNFGKTGMSVSTGVPGFRKTFHTSGRVTTSVGIPGTGIYYVDTKNTRTQNSSRDSRQSENTYSRITSAYSAENDYSGPSVADNDEYEPVQAQPIVQQIDVTSLTSIHKTSDDTVDWTEVLVSPAAPDSAYNQQMWEYYHTMAPKVLSGDIDSFLQLIYEVNPLEDLLAYGSEFEFGTDDPKKIEVEFSINEKALSEARNTMSRTEYNDLLQDYICSTCIRIARDMFALLPIRNTIVHAILDGVIVASVDFDRANLSKVKFGYIDPSEILGIFRHNMLFNKATGFLPVTQIE